MARLDRWRSILRQGSSFAFLTALATILGLIAAVVSSYELKYKSDDELRQSDQNRMFAIQQRAQIEQANDEIHELRMTNESILQSLKQLKRSGKSVTLSTLDPSDRQKIDEIASAQRILDTRLSGLEAAILTTPEKAVAVPMLKQEVDSLQDRTRSDLDGIRSEISRLFALTQWFIGLMFTIALGMFGLSFNLRRSVSGGPAPEKS